MLGFFLFKQQDFSQWKFISRLEIQKRNRFFFFHERLFWHLLISTCASKVLKFLLVINWVQLQPNLPFYPGTIIFIACFQDWSYTDNVLMNYYIAVLFILLLQRRIFVVRCFLCHQTNLKLQVFYLRFGNQNYLKQSNIVC